MGWLYPQQLSVVIFKIALVSIAGVMGYWLVRALFPYARPDGYLALSKPNRYQQDIYSIEKADYPIIHQLDFVFALAMLRRAVIVGAAMLAVGLGA